MTTTSCPSCSKDDFQACDAGSGRHRVRESTASRTRVHRIRLGRRWRVMRQTLHDPSCYASTMARGVPVVARGVADRDSASRTGAATHVRSTNPQTSALHSTPTLCIPFTAGNAWSYDVDTGEAIDHACGDSCGRPFDGTARQCVRTGESRSSAMSSSPEGIRVLCRMARGFFARRSSVGATEWSAPGGAYREAYLVAVDSACRDTRAGSLRQTASKSSRRGGELDLEVRTDLLLRASARWW